MRDSQHQSIQLLTGYYTAEFFQCFCVRVTHAVFYCSGNLPSFKQQLHLRFIIDIFYFRSSQCNLMKMMVMMGNNRQSDILIFYDYLLQERINHHQSCCSKKCLPALLLWLSGAKNKIIRIRIQYTTQKIFLATISKFSSVFNERLP